MKFTDLANTIQNKINCFENIASENEAIAYVLKEYKALCNSLDFDYEFNSIEDIKNNDGSFNELNDFFKKYVELRFIANTDYIDCNDGDNEDKPFQVEVTLYNPTTTDDESCVYQFFFNTTKQALLFSNSIDKVRTYRYNVIESLYKTYDLKH